MQRKKLKKGYWQNIENRRLYFLELAKEVGIDSTDITNLLKITRRQVESSKVMREYSPKYGSY